MGLQTFVNESHVYFRPPLLLALVWFLYGVTVFVFKKTNLDYAKALGFNHETTLSPANICTSALIIMAIFLVCWLMYTLRWPFSDPLVIPGVVYIISLCALFVPLDILNRRGRERLLQTLFRVFIPLPSGVLFAEVVLGDIMTSLSKALADMQVSVCVLLSHSFTEETMLTGGPFDAEISAAAPSHSYLRTSSTMLQSYEQSCSDSWLRPVITSLPFLLRFRQCIVAYHATGQAFPHLVNAAKYASAFPVIWISTFAHQFPSINSEALRRVWLFAISFNSFFSFMWDIVMDWGLSSNEARYFLLRERLLFMNNDRNSGYARLRNEDYHDYDDDEDDGDSFFASEQHDPDAELGLPRLKKLKGSDTDLLREPNDVSSPEEHVVVSGRSFQGLQKDPTPSPAGVVPTSPKKTDDPRTVTAPVEATIGSGLPAAQGVLSSGDAVWTSLLRFGNSLLFTEEPARSSSLAEGGHKSHSAPLLPSTPVFYYGAILFDFLLRVLWSFKLSVHLQLTQEGLTFVLELCEVVRRFVWFVFRIEWEIVQIEDRERLMDSIDSDAETDLPEESKPAIHHPVAIPPGITSAHGGNLGSGIGGQLGGSGSGSPPHGSSATSPEELWLTSPVNVRGKQARLRTSSDRLYELKRTTS